MQIGYQPENSYINYLVLDNLEIYHLSLDHLTIDLYRL